MRSVRYFTIYEPFRPFKAMCWSEAGVEPQCVDIRTLTIEFKASNIVEAIESAFYKHMEENEDIPNTLYVNFDAYKAICFACTRPEDPTMNFPTSYNGMEIVLLPNDLKFEKELYFYMERKKDLSDVFKKQAYKRAFPKEFKNN